MTQRFRDLLAGRLNGLWAWNWDWDSRLRLELGLRLSWSLSLSLSLNLSLTFTFCSWVTLEREHRGHKGHRGFGRFEYSGTEGTEEQRRSNGAGEAEEVVVDTIAWSIVTLATLFLCLSSCGIQESGLSWSCTLSTFGLRGSDFFDFRVSRRSDRGAFCSANCFCRYTEQRLRWVWEQQDYWYFYSKTCFWLSCKLNSLPIYQAACRLAFGFSYCSY